MTGRAAGRLIGVIALVLGLALALAGCTTIPVTGPVVAGQVINADPRDGVLQAILEGPVSGQTPGEVVRGFIDAAVGFNDDHRVAREFLAPSKRLVWSPDASVAVYPGQSSLKLTGYGTSTPKPVTGTPASSATATASVAPVPARVVVTVRTVVTGMIDQDGRYSVAVPGQQVTRKFGLIRSEGDWRIDSLNDGILVTTSDFAVTFRPFPVYFSDPLGRYLVPDVHWLPGTRGVTGTREVPTALVRAMLDGPSRYLRDAVVSGAPAGTQMAVAAVVVSDQVATVDLTEQVRRASTRQRQLLLAQLRATLSIGAISGVQITVRRTPLDIPLEPDPGAAGDPAAAAADADGPAPGQPQSDPQVGDDPVVLDSKGRVARLIGRDVTRVDGVDGLAVPGANRPAVMADHTAYAVLSAGRSRLLLQLPSAKVSTVVRGQMLTAPSFDPWGWVWTSDLTSPGWVSAARPDPGRVKVSAPWLRGKEVVALRISRDGARALVAVRYRGQAHVFIAGVLRDENGQPTALADDPLGVVPDLQSVTDASWVDEDHVVVLGSRNTRADEEPWVVQIGGTIRPTLPIRGALSVSAANGEFGLMVGTSSGTYTQVADTWSKLSSARWAAFAG